MLLIVILSVLFVPLIYIDRQIIRLRSLNPFASLPELRFEDMVRMHIHAGNIRFRVEFYMKDGTRIITGHLLRYKDMKEVFEHLGASGVNITSSGRGTTTRKK